jgi:hypothetical protein
LSKKQEAASQQISQLEKAENDLKATINAEKQHKEKLQRE